MLAGADLGREIAGNVYFLLCTFPRFPNFYLVTAYHCDHSKKNAVLSLSLSLSPQEKPRTNHSTYLHV